MLQYLIILLDDTSTSFCHYDNPKTERHLIPVETLKQGVMFGMMENLMIQFVYPDYKLPGEYQEVIESIDHFKIKSDGEDADVLVLNDWDFPTEDVDCPIVLRTMKEELFARHAHLEVLSKTPRLNIVITDVESFTDEDFKTYKNILAKLAKYVEEIYVSGKSVQLNILTDRIMLSQMNNCGAGDTSITLAPNGKFYICPAFYYDDDTDSVGDLKHGLDIKNKQLYELEYAPICRHCDAWQCKRCIWLNRKTTLEVNTPSHEQCVLGHLERNASRELLLNIRKHGTFMPDAKINEIDYLDPFDKRDEWQ